MIYRFLQLVCVVAGVVAVLAVMVTGVMVMTTWRIVGDNVLMSCGNNCSAYWRTPADIAKPVAIFLLLGAACTAGFRWAGAKLREQRSLPE